MSVDKNKKSGWSIVAGASMFIACACLLPLAGGSLFKLYRVVFAPEQLTVHVRVCQDVPAADAYKDTYELFHKQFSTVVSLFMLFGVVVPAVAYFLQRQSLKEERESIKADNEKAMAAILEIKKVVETSKTSLKGLNGRVERAEAKLQETIASSKTELEKIEKRVSGAEAKLQDAVTKAEMDLQENIKKQEQESADIRIDLKKQKMDIDVTAGMVSWELAKNKRNLNEPNEKVWPDYILTLSRFASVEGDSGFAMFRNAYNELLKFHKDVPKRTDIVSVDYIITLIKEFCQHSQISEQKDMCEQLKEWLEQLEAIKKMHCPGDDEAAGGKQEGVG